ncbi:MAG: UDP-N-acetylmuramoyl-L-alanyl-D-glutamate--2,6-diaminopimelate ligase [Burkholderiaceae bacterium]
MTPPTTSPAVAPAAGSAASPLVAQVAAWLARQLPVGARLSGDSRKLAAGDGFVAYPGGTTDGRAFIDDAIARGAAAILWDDAGHAWRHGAAVAQRGVPDLRALAGPIAAAYHGHPSERLELIAVTGTNGKTSCTQWIAQGLEARGRRSAIIGTLGSGRVGHLDPFGLTTPDAISLQGMLARFVAEGVQSVAMEASSIGLDQGRLAGTSVAVAVFTNLTHDHLDYHGSMARYAAAKARLFTQPGLRAAVVNGDDPAAALMIAAIDGPHAPARAEGEAPTRIGYRIDADRAGGDRRAAAPAVDAWLLAERIETRPDGMTVVVGGDFGRASVPLRVLGRYNVSNMLAVAGAWIGLGMPFDEAMSRLGSLEPVRGRLEVVRLADADVVAGTGGRAPLAVVDYAHTPDALVNVLGTLREVARARGGRLWCVLGAGGDRDPSKRPLMGAAAERLADHVVVTSDNPRGEPPLRILADIRAGLTREPAMTEVDRGVAIARAVAGAEAADVVLIAGKGHEDYQEIEGRRLPFSDVDEARIALIRWREHANV